MLFNLLAGAHESGTDRKILLPLTPEDIGYTDVGIAGEPFIAERPRIEHLADRRFKYRVDFEHLEVGDDVAAICVSRPTNPTGNVLTDGEIVRLDEIARAHAHHRQCAARPSAHHLHRRGRSGTRTSSSVSACPSWTAERAHRNRRRRRADHRCAREHECNDQSRREQRRTRARAGSGRQRELIRISREIIAPFTAVASSRRPMAARIPARTRVSRAIPKSMFRGLWFLELPVSSQVLYERSRRAASVLPGHHFFALAGEWPHRHQCIRVHYAQRRTSSRRPAHHRRGSAPAKPIAASKVK
jgi:valine--pyruvate aminotransferase